VEHELPARDRVAQLDRTSEPFGRVRIVREVVQLDAAPGVLRAVHRDICTAEHRRGAGHLAVRHGDADARAGDQPQPVDLDRLGERLTEPATGRERVGSRGVVAEDDRELVAPQAGGAAGLQRAKPIGDRPQHHVALRVAERVVDLLEAVEVEHEHRARTAAAAHARELLLDEAAEHHAVRQPGERVVQRVEATAIGLVRAVDEAAERQQQEREEHRGLDRDEHHDGREGHERGVDEERLPAVVQQRSADRHAHGE
jgi:hypothetical protein